MTNDDLGQIKHLLTTIRQDGVERAGRIESVHDTAKDTRERVIRIEGQEIPKRLDAHASALRDLEKRHHEDTRAIERRVGRLETFFVVIGAGAGAAATLVINWMSKLFGKG